MIERGDLFVVQCESEVAMDVRSIGCPDRILADADLVRDEPDCCIRVGNRPFADARDSRHEIDDKVEMFVEEACVDRQWPGRAVVDADLRIRMEAELRYHHCADLVGEHDAFRALDEEGVDLA